MCFSVSSGKFLDSRAVKIGFDLAKAKAIQDMKPPRMCKQLKILWGGYPMCLVYFCLS